MFVVDNSGSIEMEGRDGYFKQVTLFVKTIAKQFQVGDGASVTVVEASRDAMILGGSDDSSSGLEQVLDKMRSKKEIPNLGELYFS